MTEANQIGRLSPKDELSATAFFGELGITAGEEIANITSRNMHMGSSVDTSKPVEGYRRGNNEVEDLPQD